MKVKEAPQTCGWNVQRERLRSLHSTLSDENKLISAASLHKLMPCTYVSLCISTPFYHCLFTLPIRKKENTVHPKTQSGKICKRHSDHTSMTLIQQQIKSSCWAVFQLFQTGYLGDGEKSTSSFCWCKTKMLKDMDTHPCDNPMTKQGHLKRAWQDFV